MNNAEKKQAWQLIGQAVDAAAADGERAAAYLARLALLCALEIPSLERVEHLIETAHDARRASAGEAADMRAELARAW